jgi:hypothetical protein
MMAIGTFAPFRLHALSFFVLLVGDWDGGCPARHFMSAEDPRLRSPPASAPSYRAYCAAGIATRACALTAPLLAILASSSDVPVCGPFGPMVGWRCSHSTSALWWVRKTNALDSLDSKVLRVQSSHIRFPGSFGQFAVQTANSTPQPTTQPRLFQYIQD